MPGVLECVVNVSEGRDRDVLSMLATAVGDCLLDVHLDGDHHRSVLTLGGDDGEVETAVRRLATAVVEHIDLRHHAGVHPRIGALDVVPFVALTGDPTAGDPTAGDPTGNGQVHDDRPIRSLEARDRFVHWAAEQLALPCFVYGPERSLPQLRRAAWTDLVPDGGPRTPHPSAGAAAVGARSVLVAYNLWLAEPDLTLARRIAADIRGPELRTLGLAVGSEVQVSCNLIAPWSLGPAEAYDAVAARAAASGTEIARAELVGLIPASVLEAVPPDRWAALDLAANRTIESRLRDRPWRFPADR
jgi:glutamate formiminotransferase